MTVITNIEDLRVLAQQRVPRMFYDYADSGSWTESTYRANESDFQRIKLRQRVAVNMQNRSTRTQLIGIDAAMPVAIAPTGLTGMQHADGEILAARAAEKFGVPFTLSTMSICSIEDIAAHTKAPFWFQLYWMRDRDFMDSLMDRAKAAGCSALMLTLDLQVLGQRHKDLKNGLTGMQHADGEILAARAAEKFGVPFTLSTMSICSIEDIATHTKAPFWFQLYWMRDRDFMERLMDRARAARCSALVLTLDLQVLGQRHKDLKNGLTAPPKPTLANILNLMLKPRWCLGMARTRRHGFGNLIGHAKGVSDMSSLGAWTREQFDPQLDWNDVEWIKKRWGGKLILKGIMDVEDARLAADSGADAMVVSNHGGRQLDGAPSSIHALPEIADAVGSRIEVWMDGGIRSGQDVLKAWALGARGTMIGRAFLYGLGAMGEAGVTKCLEIIHKELDVTMAFCGHTKIGTVDRRILLPSSFQATC